MTSARSTVVKALSSRLVLLVLFILVCSLFAVFVLPEYFNFRSPRAWQLQIVNDIDTPVFFRRIDDGSETKKRLNPGEAYLGKDSSTKEDPILGDFAYLRHNDERLNQPDIMIGFFTEDMKPIGQVAIPILSFTNQPVVICASMAAEPPTIIPLLRERPENLCQGQAPAH